MKNPLWLITPENVDYLWKMRSLFTYWKCDRIQTTQSDITPHISEIKPEPADRKRSEVVLCSIAIAYNATYFPLSYHTWREDTTHAAQRQNKEEKTHESNICVCNSEAKEQLVGGTFKAFKCAVGNIWSMKRHSICLKHQSPVGIVQEIFMLILAYDSKLHYYDNLCYLPLEMAGFHTWIRLKQVQCGSYSPGWRPA